MKLTAFLLVAPAFLAAAFPTGDVLSEIERREASPVAEADPIYYSMMLLSRSPFTGKLLTPILTVKRAGYTDKREANPEAEADPIYYIKRAGYTDKREASPEAEAEADPIYYSMVLPGSPWIGKLLTTMQSSVLDTQTSARPYQRLKLIPSTISSVLAMVTRSVRWRLPNKR